MKKAAVIGLGDISPIHLAAIAGNPDIELCAVCDIDPEAGDVYKRQPVKCGMF